ncbi:hypothetical protein K5D32_25755, partial [Pseudomonas cichorii]|uniref:hypothetical protein n=1 Tax=Pseudomonas cichorii TaxID=36746 RepID=UPI001C8A4EF3
AIMRKKLRTFLWITCDQFSLTHAVQALQPSAQEVAQWCATSCALSTGFPPKKFPPKKLNMPRTNRASI